MGGEYNTVFHFVLYTIIFIMVSFVVLVAYYLCNRKNKGGE